MLRNRLARLGAMCAATAFACAPVSAWADAAAANATFSWTAMAAGPQSATFKLDTPTSASGDAILILNVSGDFDLQEETLTVKIGGKTIETLFDVDSKPGYGIQDCSPEKYTQSLTIPQSMIEGLIIGGSVTLELKTSSDVELCEGEGLYYSAALDGSLYVPSSGEFAAPEEDEPSPVEQTTTVASSMTQSRTSVTISSLPTLSGRARGGAPTGGGGGGGVSGAGGSSSGSFAFSADLSGMRRAAAAREAARRFAELGEDRVSAAETAMQASLDDAASAAGASSSAESAAAYDVWFGGTFSYFDVELGGIGQTGGVGTLQMGVDTRLSERLLVGAAAFGDLLQSDVSTGSTSSGIGVMAGPYAVLELDHGLYLEVLGAYGVAFNRIESEGLRDARYESRRQLYTGRLSGDWRAGDWLLRPSTRLTYYAESQESFDVGDGTIAPSDFTELGQLRFGPEIAYQMFWEGGAFLPFVSIEGVWAFKQSEQAINGVVVTGEELTGALALGFDARVGSTTIRAGGRLDGIGEPRLDTLTGEIAVRTPLP